MGKTIMGMINEANQIKPDIHEKYKELLSSFDYEPHYVDRDGDLFRITCPSCGSQNTHFVGWGMFICGRKHVFNIYTEDGVRADSELSSDRKKRVLGDDLQKNGKDCHGHDDYHLFNKDDIAPFVFDFYFGWDTDKEEQTFEKAQHYTDFLKSRIDVYREQFQRFYNPIRYWYVDLSDASGGNAGSTVKTWPEYMNIKKAILLMAQIKKWNEEIKSEDESRHYSLYLFKRRV